MTKHKYFTPQTAKNFIPDPGIFTRPIRSNMFIKPVSTGSVVVEMVDDADQKDLDLNMYDVKKLEHDKATDDLNDAEFIQYLDAMANRI